MRPERWSYPSWPGLVRDPGAMSIFLKSGIAVSPLRRMSVTLRLHVFTEFISQRLVFQLL